MAGLKGKRVFVAEDETMISMLFEDILFDLECEIVGPALNIKQATDLARSEAMDAAVLDINLAGDPIYAVAEILAERGVPLVFSSGYGSSVLPERWQDRPTLPKPFTFEEVADVLNAMIGDHAA